MIEVHYVDDCRITHICFITTQEEVIFLQNRYGKENVTVYL